MLPEPCLRKAQGSARTESRPLPSSVLRVSVLFAPESLNPILVPKAEVSWGPCCGVAVGRMHMGPDRGTSPRIPRGFSEGQGTRAVPSGDQSGF